ncbi:MAG: 3-hydroxyacyl-ACP dehydratase FabZ family protein [Saprospiraceae bacterium]
MNTLTFPKPATLLPHRPPMLLVDEIVSYEPGVSLAAKTCVDADMPFFKGHFPGYPMLPGVILVEMMFQTCGLFGRMEMIENTTVATGAGENSSDKKMMGRAIKIDKTTFAKPVFPDEKLKIVVAIKQKFMDFSIYDGKVLNEANEIVAKGQITVHLTKPK